MERFGESLLGAPVNRGFGRMAWLGPIFAGLVGLGVIWVFLRRFRSRRDERAEEPADPEIDAVMRARIEDELKAHRG